MQKKFIKNLAFLLFLNLLIKPFWILGIDRGVQNVLGAEEYGFYYAVFNFSFLLNILLDFGITNFNNKNIAQNNHLLRKHLSSIIVLKMLLGGIYLLVTFIGAFVIGYSRDQLTLLIFLALNQFLISFILYLRSNLSGLHLFKIDSMISVLDRLIMIIVCGILLWGNTRIDFTISWYVIAQTFAYVVTALIALIIVFRKAKSRFLTLNWSLPFSIVIIRNSFPFAVLVLLMTFYNRIDSVMIERLLPDGAEQAGIYASAYRLLDATNMIAYLFSVLLLPIFSRMIKLRDPIEDLVRLSFSLLIVAAAMVASISFFFRFEIMGLLYKEHIEQSALVFGYLMACFVPIATTYIFGTLLTANGNLKYLNIVALSGMVINIVLNTILIPVFEVQGAGFVSLTTQTLTAVAQVIIATRIFHFKVNYVYLGRLFAFFAIAAACTYGATQLPCGWIIQVVVAAAVASSMAFVTRLLSIRGMLKILKYG
ncbi:MAG: oligosaccharide flippase family protein [Bacteroidetes bacterium]|nr:oligosaccharide flippase family protein [Bacteroidota bacterium]